MTTHLKLIGIFTLLMSFNLLAQNRVLVADSLSNEPIPFAKIQMGSGQIKFSDINGIFLVESLPIDFTVRCSGYFEAKYEAFSKDTLFMRPVVQNINEIVVRPGENPAHRIIESASANRKKNHPEENYSFRYDLYSKFSFELNEYYKESLQADMEDSAFFENSHLYLMESVSERIFIPPFRSKETITSCKTAGMPIPELAGFAQSMQSFHFYDNLVNLGGRKYLNPIAAGSTKRYFFELQDTTYYASGDTLFTIYFRPYKGKNFEGMEGRIFINSQDYAIEKVTAQPYDFETNSMKITQTYQNKDGHWFPESFKTEIAFNSSVTDTSANNPPIMHGQGVSFVKNLEIEPEDLRKVKFNNYELELTEEAFGNDRPIESMRGEEFSEKDSLTYDYIDQFFQENKQIPRLLTASRILASGQIPIKKVALPLDKLIRYNNYEGIRLGLGLENKQGTLGPVILGGYFAYGFKDKALKYGGYSKINLYREKSMRLLLGFSDDVQNRGTTFSLLPEDWKTNNSLANYYFSAMDSTRTAEIQFEFKPKANIGLAVRGAYKRITFTRGYTYSQENTMFSEIEQAVITYYAHWHLFRKAIRMGYIDQLQPSNWPQLSVQVDQGIKDLFSSSSNFLRGKINLAQYINLGRGGGLRIAANYQFLQGNAPLLFQIDPGGAVPQRKKDLAIDVSETFATLMPTEFYTKQLFSSFFRYTFPPIRSKLDWTKPTFGLHQAYGIGRTTDDVQFTNAMGLSLNQGHLESGILVNNLLVSGISGIGAGIFYRYGAAALPQSSSNFFWKISMSILL